MRKQMNSGMGAKLSEFPLGLATTKHCEPGIQFPSLGVSVFPQKDEKRAALKCYIDTEFCDVSFTSKGGLADCLKSSHFPYL